MLSEKVARLRQLMSEAVPKNDETPSEMNARRQFLLYEFNAAPLVVEQSPRARVEREISRIASWYGWTCEVIRALDAARVATVQGLCEDRLQQLERMRQLEQCAQEGLDPPDALPAR
jgi:hypothetical protein